jgi:hypothetical protein
MVWQILNRWVQSFETAAAERESKSRLIYVQHLRNAWVHSDIGLFGNGPFGVWVLAGPRSSSLYVANLPAPNIMSFNCHLYSELAVASQIGVQIDILGVVLPPWLRCGLPILIALSLSKSSSRSVYGPFPPSFLLAPVAGEVFDNPGLCQERPQGWALSQGFAIVRTSGGVKASTPTI